MQAVIDDTNTIYLTSDHPNAEPRYRARFYFDPNSIPKQYSQLNRDPQSPLFNRATQARYPPGSTFKVVTAAAAIDSGRYRATRRVICSDTPWHTAASS